MKLLRHFRQQNYLSPMFSRTLADIGNGTYKEPDSNANPLFFAELLLPIQLIRHKEPVKKSIFRTRTLKNINSLEAHFINANMTTVDLTDAVIRFAELELVNLSDANLTNCDFSYSSLFGANLSGAILNGAKLFNTDLRQANLENTQLKNVYFSQCRVAGAVFTNAKGLSTLQKHWLKDNGALNIF